ncbi:MAG TPA: hypothetical protein VN316_00235 [candidate division Zixibacteria bacterium]|nr:hypothetical protein [candidate division Zixibacteria bacterium]
MAKSSKPDNKSIEQYKGKERCNNPPVGLVTPETDSYSCKNTYSYDLHLDPALVWAGKAEHTSFEIPTVSLHVHERIDPRTIIEAVRKRNGGQKQLSLFEDSRGEVMQINLSPQRAQRTQSAAATFGLWYEIATWRIRTRMTRIARIFTDPCASASSAQSVFHPNKFVGYLSAFICVHLRLIKISRMMFSRFIFAEVV